MKINVIIKAVILALGLSGIGMVAYALDYPHNSLNNYGCSSCHSLHGGSSGLLPAHEPQNIDDTKRNVLCWSCHNDDVAPYVKTHSSLTTDNGYGDWTAECTTCHEPHQQKQFRDYDSETYYLHQGVSTSLPTETTLTQTGAGWTLNAYKGLIVVPNIAEQNYNYKITGNTADTLTVAGPMDLGKVSEGDTFVIIYGKLIRSEISTPNSEDKETKLFKSTGDNSFADGDTTYDGVCEVCHTQTIHFRYDGLGVDQLHTNVGGPAGEDCIDCHAHENGFGHGGGSGCIPCHGHDKDTVYDPDASAPYTPGATASQGKGTYQSHSTHTESDSDDLRGAGIYCDTCHDINNFPYFISGTIIIDDGKYDLDETDVCNNCHSNGGAFDGVNETTYGAKSNWSDGIYAGDNLKSGKENWCASCHDADLATSNQDGTGVTAPDIAGDETNYGYYYSGHGKNLMVQCTGCHDSSVDHLDGEPRTYTFDTADYAPAQSGIAYASGYRLQDVGSEVPLMIPANYNITFGYDAGLMKNTAFRLCFSCHHASLLLDDTPGDGIDSSFKASLPNPPRNYSYAWGSGADVNEHVSHIMNYIGPFADSDWDAATDGPGGSNGNDSMTACSICHNVHGAAGAMGSANEAMIRDGSLTGRTGYGFSYVLEDVGAGGYPWVTSTGATQSTSVGAIFRDNTTNMCGGSMCHGNPTPPSGASYDASGSSWGTYLEYYRPPTGIDTYTCTACHGQPPDGETAPNRAGSHATHFTSTNGPQIALGTCDDCHLFSTPTHNDGEVTFADSLPLAATHACDTCHSPDGTYDGIDDPVIGAKNNWDNGVYTGSNLMTGKEKWCAGCHDDSPSVIETVSAPNVVGDEDAAINYGTGYGFYKTGHGLPAKQTYPASGGTVSGAGISCGYCHDFTMAHIDGVARTYDDTAIVGNADDYQHGYRLKLALDIPRTDAGMPVSDFDLCYQCHALDPHLVETNYTTNFRDDPDVRNDHWYHLQTGGPYANRWDSDWDGTGDSQMSCPSCHNVHGSEQLAMVRDGKLVNRTPGLEVVYYNSGVSFDCSNYPDPANVSLPESTGTIWRPNVGGLCGACHGSCGLDTVYYRSNPPQITQVQGQVGSNILTIGFSVGVYSDFGASGDLVVGDFVLTDLDDSRTITGVNHIAGENTAALTLNSDLDATDDIGTDTLAAATSTSIYDAAGVPMDTTPVTIMGVPAADSDPPIISDQMPVNGATGVDTYSNLTFRLSDSGRGVDWATFEVQITGDQGYSELYTDADFLIVSKTGNSAVYDVTVNPDVDFGGLEIITVTVHVDDYAENSLSPPTWSFTTAEAAILQIITLHPSGLASSTVTWSIVGGVWTDILDTDDGDISYVHYCCSSPGQIFYVDMDDSGLTGVTIESIRIYVYARFVDGPGPSPSPYAGNVNVGYKTGTNTVWEGNTTTDTTGNYNLISSSTYTTDSDSGALDLADINNLRIAVQRNASGSPQLRVTEVYVEVTYFP